MAAIPRPTVSIEVDPNKLNTLRGGKNSYTIPQLKDISRKLNLQVSGNKTQLVNRIRQKLGLSAEGSSETIISTIGTDPIEGITTNVSQLNIYSDAPETPSTPTTSQSISRQLGDLPATPAAEPIIVSILSLKRELEQSLPDKIMLEQDRCNKIRVVLRDAKRRGDQVTRRDAEKELNSCERTAESLIQDFDYVRSIENIQNLSGLQDLLEYLQSIQGDILELFPGDIDE